jgi:ABC-type transport system involved in cytochrome c biogenesis permease subunit
MRQFLLPLFLLLCGLTFGRIATAEDRFDWDIWRALPVQNGGRQKPLDTLARETLRGVAHRESLSDPETTVQLDPVAWYMTMLFDWQGWEHADKSQLELVADWGPLYFHLHAADKWDQSPLLRVDFLPLRNALDLTADNHISPQRLADCRFEDRQSKRKIPFLTWAETLLVAEEAGRELTEFEKKGLELANRLWSYQNHRMGRTLELLPTTDSGTQKWNSPAYLLLSRFDNSNDPTGALRESQKLFRRVRKSFRDQDIAAFNATSREFVALVQRLAPPDGGYLSPGIAALEVAYNHWDPFRLGGMFMLAAAILVLLHFGSLHSSSQGNWIYRGASACYLGGLVALATGFGMRIAIAGRPPVTNMYESLIYVGAGVAILGGLLELISRKTYTFAAAATVATIVLAAADNSPLLLDPGIRPLEPILRSNFWLATHVLTITLSYSSLALALGIANITLSYLLLGKDDPRVLDSLSRLTDKAIQAGVLLLATGVILGCVWADFSWGRFWGWDPKEVWALVALLGYLAVLHARHAGWVGDRGLAVLSVACFSLVVMAWYGVNFVLGVGLHSYGFGGGGEFYVGSAVALQLFYAAAVLLRTAFADPEARSFVPILRRRQPGTRRTIQQPTI